MIKSVKMAETLESERKEEDVELDLGLAIGRSFGNRGRPTVMTGESMDLKKKPKKREIRGGTDLDCGSEGEEKNHGQRNKKERPSPIIPMQYSNPPSQYLPMTAIDGFVFPCVMPWWGHGSDAGNFNPYRCNVNNGDNKKISDGLPACNSPAVADNQSCSDEGTVSLFDDGSRSDTKSHESNGSINKFNNTASSRRPDELSVSGDLKVAESNRIIKKSNNVSLSLASMPCVSTMGEGPESKRIIGFLYRYSKSEVSIVCVCHGKSFSPAEFVKHAGGTEVSNPLKHIKVIPSAFA